MSAWALFYTNVSTEVERETSSGGKVSRRIKINPQQNWDREQRLLDRNIPTAEFSHKEQKNVIDSHSLA